MSAASPPISSSEEDGKEEDDDEEEITSLATEQEYACHEYNLIKLWVAADRLLVPSLQNLIIRKLEDMWDTTDGPFASTTWVPYIYKHTATDCPLRKLVVDCYAYCLTARHLKTCEGSFPNEFLFDLAMVFAAHVGIAEDTEVLAGVERHTYHCTRTWRSYLVPEDVW